MLEYIIGVTLCPLLAGGCKNIYNAGYCEVSCGVFFFVVGVLVTQIN